MKSSTVSIPPLVPHQISELSSKEESSKRIRSTAVIHLKPGTPQSPPPTNPSNPEDVRKDLNQNNQAGLNGSNVENGCPTGDFISFTSNLEQKDPQQPSESASKEDSSKRFRSNAFITLETRPRKPSPPKHSFTQILSTNNSNLNQNDQSGNSTGNLISFTSI